MPRYQNTWDVGVVVHYLSGLVPSEEQSLQVLSKKLVTLLALANASRASDLHALDLQYHQFSQEGVLFHIPTLTKTRRSGPPKTTFISKFEEEPAICPVNTLRVYVDRTKHMRKQEENGRLPLLFFIQKATQSCVFSHYI